MYVGQKIMNYSDRGGNRTHDPAREVDSQRVTYKGTFPTSPSRTVRAPFDAHGSPEIGPHRGYSALSGVPSRLWGYFSCTPSPCIGHYPDLLSTMGAPSP
jgi:hypothetical protein